MPGNVKKRSIKSSNSALSGQSEDSESESAELLQPIQPNSKTISSMPVASTDGICLRSIIESLMIQALPLNEHLYSHADYLYSAAGMSAELIPNIKCKSGFGASPSID